MAAYEHFLPIKTGKTGKNNVKNSEYLASFIKGQK